MRLKPAALLISLTINILLAGYLLVIHKNQGAKPADNFHANTKRIETSDDIYFIGNSIISEGNWNKQFTQKKIVNKGIAGITTFDAIMMFDKIITGRPREVFILLGVNDFKVKAPVEVAYKNYIDFVASIKYWSPKTKINIISVLPVNSSFKTYAIDNSSIIAYNLKIQAFAEKYEFTYIDAHAALVNNKGELAKEYTTDGLHLTQLGYDKLFAAIASHL